MAIHSSSSTYLKPVMFILEYVSVWGSLPVTIINRRGYLKEKDPLNKLKANLLLKNMDDWHCSVHVGVKALLQGLLVVVAAAGPGGTSCQTPGKFQ